MALTCTRCENSGFLNLHQIEDEKLRDGGDTGKILQWIAENEAHDVQVCDCCGDGEGWYGVPGEHYNSEDPSGNNGVYGYNGGYCECH